MKTRSIFAVISLSLALIVLFAALPLQAQTNSNVTISNFSYDGIDASTHQFTFSWDTITNSSVGRFQVKGDCLSSTWLGIPQSGYSVSSSGGTTFLRMGIPRSAGCDLRFRLKLRLSQGSTPWAYTSN